MTCSCHYAPWRCYGPAQLPTAPTAKHKAFEINHQISSLWSDMQVREVVFAQFCQDIFSQEAM